MLGFRPGLPLVVLGAVLDPAGLPDRHLVLARNKNTDLTDTHDLFPAPG